MEIPFVKYQGTGNDFILIDNREQFLNHKFEKEIPRMCDRRFGIGADGLMLIEKSTLADFKVIYFNADGSQSLCGNGSRCAAAFSHSLGILGMEGQMEAYDGVHRVLLEDLLVAFQIFDIEVPAQTQQAVFINNGSPHHIEYCENVNSVNVKENGFNIRNSDRYAPNGTNVNFVQVQSDQIKVRTYERGVEDETLSCGTGVTAAAVASAMRNGLTSPLVVETRGGSLQVRFTQKGNLFTDLYLVGPAEFVFKGSFKSTLN